MGDNVLAMRTLILCGLASLAAGFFATACTFPPTASGCGATGCFNKSTNCTAAPFYYCPNDDKAWATHNPQWKDCLSDKCYNSTARVGNSSCAKDCSPLWEAQNRCAADNCNYAIAGTASDICKITPIIWTGSSGWPNASGWPDTKNTQTCMGWQEGQCSLYACAINSGGEFEGCWKPEDD